MDNMSNHRGPSKKKPGANVDFTPVIPKFLQGMIKPNPKPREEGDSDGDDSKPTLVDLPKGKERPDLEDEAPTIVADDEILALLAKQEHKLVDGKFERISTAQDDSQARNDDSAVEFGKKARPKKAGLDSTQKSSSTATTTSNDKETKKRPAETNAETLNPTKRVEKKKMLSFDDEEDL